MASNVYFTDMRAGMGNSLLDKMDKLARESGLMDIDMKKKFVAIKIHFGEYGNLSYPKPQFVKVIADIVKEKGGIPYMVDCNTLYVGVRKNAVEHLTCAEMNGFNTVTTGCHAIIGDGLKGSDDVEIPVEGGQYVETAKIGRGIADADIIITLNHFKGHEVTGIGGALKNLGMGCASRRGKMELHTSNKAHLNTKLCIGCNKCSGHCAQGALKLVKKKMTLNTDKCVGCGRCIPECNQDALYANQDDAHDIVDCRIVEYSKAVIAGKPNFHFTLLMDVSPLCDCYGFNDAPIIPNVGMFASADPVAIDRACAEIAQKQPVIPGSVLDMKCKGCKPKDIWNLTNDDTDWRVHLKHAKKIGMGDGSYKLVELK